MSLRLVRLPESDIAPGKNVPGKNAPGIEGRRRKVWTGATLIALLALSACSTVTVRDAGKAKLASEPTYESSEAFFFWGLVGEKHVDVRQICGNARVRQLQAQNTFMDSFLAVITLGIYSPRSVKVWCDKETHHD